MLQFLVLSCYPGAPFCLFLLCAIYSCYYSVKLCCSPLQMLWTTRCYVSPLFVGYTGGVLGHFGCFSWIAYLVLLAQGTAAFSEGWVTVRLDFRAIFQRKRNADMDIKTTAQIGIKPSCWNHIIHYCRGVARKHGNLVLLPLNFSGWGLFLAVCLRNQRFSVLFQMGWLHGSAG